MQSIVYHQTAGKGIHGYAVMIYSSKGADEMHAKAWWYAKKSDFLALFDDMHANKLRDDMPLLRNG